MRAKLIDIFYILFRRTEIGIDFICLYDCCQKCGFAIAYQIADIYLPGAQFSRDGCCDERIAEFEFCVRNRSVIRRYCRDQFISSCLILIKCRTRSKPLLDKRLIAFDICVCQSKSGFIFLFFCFGRIKIALV